MMLEMQYMCLSSRISSQKCCRSIRLDLVAAVVVVLYQFHWQSKKVESTTGAISACSRLIIRMNKVSISARHQSS